MRRHSRRSQQRRDCAADAWTGRPATAALLLVAGLAGCQTPRPIPDYVRSPTSPAFGEADGPRNDDARREAVAKIVAENPELSLDALLRAAEAAHPTLLAAEQRARAAEGRAWQASLRENPSLTLRREGPVEHPGIRRTENWVEYAQPIVMSDRLERAEAAELASRDELLLVIDEERAALHGAVREAYFEVLSLRARSAIVTDALALATEIDQLATRRVEAGAALRTESLKTGLEVSRLESERVTVEAAARAAAAELSALIGGVQIDPARITGAFDGVVTARDTADDETRLRNVNPTLRRARAAIVTAEARLAAEESASVSDIEAFVAAGYSGEEDNDRQVIELGVTIPLPFHDVNQGRVLAARRELRAARWAVRSIEEQLHARLERVHGEYEGARRRAEALLDRLIPAAQAALTEARQAYDAGAGSFLDLLDALRTLTDLRRERLDALRDAHIATTRIVALTGGTP